MISKMADVTDVQIMVFESILECEWFFQGQKPDVFFVLYCLCFYR
jgi:hypothetical protein